MEHRSRDGTVNARDGGGFTESRRVCLSHQEAAELAVEVAVALIAALFVETNGHYFGLPDVDPWDKNRDARKYSGPHPVVAHPACERWGRYWGGGPNVKIRKIKGADEGCF